MHKVKFLIRTTVVLTTVAAMGCTSHSASVTDSQRALEAKDRQVASLESELAASKSQVSSLEKQVQVSGTAGVVGGDLFPPAAKPGECYTRVLIPAEYKTESEQILKKAESSRIAIVPAKYETVEEQVLIKEATERIEVVPGTYEWAEERVLVAPASKRLENIPAEHEWTEEKILVKPAHQMWKKGRGPIEKVDHTTGEIVCLVEVPAQYKTVRKKILKSAAATREIEIPAVYKTVRKQVVKTSASTRSISIPAVYKTVKVRKMTTPPQENRTVIPAEYGSLTRRVKVTEEVMAWRPVLCETNTRPGVVRELQSALRAAGHNPGPIDGQLGSQTLSAVRSYQQKKGLPTGGLTLSTLDSLGVNLGR